MGVFSIKVPYEVLSEKTFFFPTVVIACMFLSKGDQEKSSAINN